MIIILLNKSCLIIRPKYVDLNMTLFRTTSKKQKFNLFSNYIKTFYNKAITKCIYYKKLFDKAIDFWILLLKLI